MKSLFFLLPLLGAVTLAQNLSDNICQCPQVKCPSNDAAALCRCMNSRERRCKERCPKYSPTYRYCPLQPTPASSPTPTLTPIPEPTSKLVFKPEAAGDCECEQSCIQLWPNYCYCANAAAKKCHKKCGGKKPTLQLCPSQTSKTLQTRIKPATTKSTTATSSSSTSPPAPTSTHKVCGGGRLNYQTCDEGDVCITDPYTPGCGPACDGLGICVKDKLCDGFAGFKCDEPGQICHDDPRDDCDLMNGGADCGGLCVWPHESLYGGDQQQ